MAENPLFGRTGRHGTHSERRVAKAVGGRLTPGSGAFTGHKGDFRKGRTLAECKSTVQMSATLKLDWLNKITQEAVQKGCDPALFLSFVTSNGKPKPGGDWVLVPKYVWDELTEE